MGRIITKNSDAAGVAPGSLAKGELAINVVDGKLFYGDGSTVKTLTVSGSGGGGGTVTSVQLTAGTGIGLGGTNPITTTGNITITNNAPDQTVTLGSGTGINITGTYPSFTIASTINSSTFLTTSSFNSWTGSSTSQFAGTSSFATTASYALNIPVINTGSLLTTASFNSWTGSTTSQFAGTSSYASQSLSSSYATTASYVASASYATSASQSTSASFAISASYALSSSFATTASSVNSLIQDVVITGSLSVTNDAIINNAYIGNITSFGTNYMSFSHIFRTGSNDYSLLSDNAGITYLNASTGQSLKFRINNVDKAILDSSGNLIIGKTTAANAVLDVNGDVIVTGSITSTLGFTGSLQGTASYATTASYAMNAGGTPGGSNTQIQFNANNAFSGSPNFTFNSGSNTLTLTGSLNITGSTTQTGNNTLIGNTVLSGSIGISGSSTIQGTTTMTGSLLITGSTTQIGDNHLFGDTLLSGSILISGSYPVGSYSSSVNIYGDTSMTGYLKFNPNPTNIDPNVSASYIYNSGSTNDLYFAQNSNGYNNVTRLRWLEGGALYTGLLQGGILSSTPGTTTFKITSGSGLIVTMNAFTASEPYPTSQYISWPEYNAQPIQYSGSAQITYVGIKSDGTIQQQTVPWGTNDINQWDNSIALGVILTLSGSVSSGVFNAPQISYGQAQKADDFFRAFGPLKTAGHTLKASGSTMSIIKDAGTSYREGSNYSINPNHPSTVVENSISVSKIYRYYLSGSTPVIDTGVASAGYTAIDNTKYVDTTTGLLDNVTNGQFSLQRVFWVPNAPPKAFIVYYGNAKYNSLADAISAQYTEPFTEAPNTAQNAIFLGYIAVRGGVSTTDLTAANDASIIQSGLFRSVGGIGSSGTNFVSTKLSSLADVSLSGNTPGDLLVYGTGTTWNNKKQLTGSYGLTGSLTVTQNISASSFTGSLLGTASFATTASYALNSAGGSGGISQGKVVAITLGYSNLF